MDRRRFIKTAGLGSIALSATGCLGDGDGTEPAPDTDTPEPETDTPGGGDTPTEAGGNVEMPDPLSIGRPSPLLAIGSFAMDPMFDDVVNEEYGIDTEHVIYSGFTPMVGGFLQGETTMGYLAALGFFNAANQNIPVRAFCGYLNYLPSTVSVAPGMSLSDMEGGTIAVHAPGSNGELFAKLFANEEFGDVDAVNLEYIIGTTNRISALEQGQVDAYVGLLAHSIHAENEGTSEILAVPWDYDTLENAPAQMWVCLEDQINESPGVFQNIADSFQTSYDAVYDADPAELVPRALQNEDYTELSEEAWIQALEIGQDNEIWGTDVPVEGHQHTMDVMSDLGLLETQPDPEEITTQQFV